MRASFRDYRLAPVENLISNPSGEYSHAYWGQYGSSGSNARTTTSSDSWVGSRSILIEMVGDSVATVQGIVTVSGAFSPIASGVWLSIAGRAKFSGTAVPNPYNPFQIMVRDNTKLATFASLYPEHETLTNGWIELKIAILVPNDYTAEAIYILGRKDDSSIWRSGDLIHFDGIQVHSSASKKDALMKLSSYFDGSTPGCKWLGEPHLSPSVGYGYSRGA